KVNDLLSAMYMEPHSPGGLHFVTFETLGENPTPVPFKDLPTIDSSKLVMKTHSLSLSYLSYPFAHTPTLPLVAGSLRLENRTVGVPDLVPSDRGSRPLVLGQVTESLALDVPIGGTNHLISVSEVRYESGIALLGDTLEARGRFRDAVLHEARTDLRESLKRNRGHEPVNRAALNRMFPGLEVSAKSLMASLRPFLIAEDASEVDATLKRLEEFFYRLAAQSPTLVETSERDFLAGQKIPSTLPRSVPNPETATVRLTRLSEFFFESAQSSHLARERGEIENAKIAATNAFRVLLEMHVVIGKNLGSPGTKRTLHALGDVGIMIASMIASWNTDGGAHAGLLALSFAAMADLFRTTWVRDNVLRSPRFLFPGIRGSVERNSARDLLSQGRFENLLQVGLRSPVIINPQFQDWHRAASELAENGKLVSAREMLDVLKLASKLEADALVSCATLLEN
ncbi:MAG TPA: hypothetical protein PLH57_09245, partial [Oligoflexia bacterium]|nr:hypothetical protein [Oligoflexia bacterium]